MIMPLWLIYVHSFMHKADYCMIRLFQSCVYTYNPYDPLVTLTYPHLPLMHTPS